jgi:ABC-2 type transport system ATP-binding protein
VALLALAPAAHARDAVVQSFDGTPIVTHFFPAPGLGPGERAPTLFIGHGWGGSGEESPPEQYAEAGYNVLTWDARGFGGSGGTAMIDHPEYEARDVQALIDFLANQPEAQLDAPGDPRVGMDGGSYGGGIQFITAARDPRVDVIAPTIAWNSLNRALYRSDVVKAGWDLALVGTGIATSLAEGIFSPAGVQTGHQSELFYDAVVEGVSTGQLSPEFQAWLAAHGPRGMLDRIRIPTLIVQGTADTLFTLDEAHDNYLALKRNRIPLKMIWFCGGHGLCRTTSDAEAGTDLFLGGRLAERRKVAWFARYLKGRESVDTGPKFEWPDEDGVYHTAGGYPPERIGTATGSGTGSIGLTPGALPGSGVLISASPTPGGVTARVDVPPGKEVVGAPTLRMTYSATGVSTRPDGRTAIYAQLVDRRRDVVVNNFATPVPIELDGRVHEIELPLETIASVSTGAGYELQLVPHTSVYDFQRATGVVDIRHAEVELPLTRAAGGGCNRVVGKRGSDRLRGTSGDDCLSGRGGADRLSGKGGNDELRGGRGQDRLRGGRGRDVFRAAGAGPDRIDCGPGRDKALVTRADRWRRCERVRRR